MQYVIWFIILLFIIGQCSKKDNTSYTPRTNSSSYSTSYTPSISTANSTKTTTPTPSTSTIQSKPQTKTQTKTQTKITNESKNCDPNYTWCVPIASDVDCAGWRGNWPEYVRWPIRVIWRDIYDLDRDGDGIACE